MDEIYDSIAGQKLFRLSVGLFAFFLLFALIGFHDAWIAAAGRGFQLHFDIAVPWLFVLIVGMNVFASAMRKQMKYQIAATVLTMLAFAVEYSYEAMGKFAGLIH